MTKQQAEEKFIELMSYIMDNNPNVEPIYESYEEFYKTNKKSHQENYNKFERALKYFKGEKIGRGTKPQLSTYVKMMSEGSESLEQSESIEQSESNSDSTETDNEEIQDSTKDDILNSKTDFLSNKMSVQLTTTNKLMDKFKPKGKQGRGFNDENFVTKHQNAFGGIIGAGAQGFNITHNPNYLRKDYFDYLKQEHPKVYGDWTRDTTQDLDKDGINDIILYDDKSRMRFWNGYGLASKGVDKDGKNPTVLSSQRQKWLLTNPEDEGYSQFINYYHELPGHAPKPKKAVDATINEFLKALGDDFKNYAKTFNTHDKMIFQHSNYKARIKSKIIRYVCLPYILFAQGYTEPDVKAIIFAKDKTAEMSTLRRIWSDDDIKKLLKDSTELAAVVKQVEEAIFNDLKNSNGKELQFLISLIKEDGSIEPYFYNVAVLKAKNDGYLN